VVEFTVQVGGEKPDALRTEMLAALAKKQRGDGSWPVEGTDSNYGPAYCTAEAVLALTADRRRLRVFQAPRPKEGPGRGATGRTSCRTQTCWQGRVTSPDPHFVAPFILP
jgi:hypothetical protein